MNPLYQVWVIPKRRLLPTADKNCAKFSLSAPASQIKPRAKLGKWKNVFAFSRMCAHARPTHANLASMRGSSAKCNYIHMRLFAYVSCFYIWQPRICIFNYAKQIAIKWIFFLYKHIILFFIEFLCFSTIIKISCIYIRHGYYKKLTFSAIYIYVYKIKIEINLNTS